MFGDLESRIGEFGIILNFQFLILNYKSNAKS
jgi:hypothetical protein